MKEIKFLQKVCLVLFGLIISLVLLETVLRICGYVYLINQEFKNMEFFKKVEYPILFLGESTTADGYPDQVSVILNSMNLNKEIRVINKGVHGTNTGIILTRLENYLKKYRPRIVVTMMGLNDRSAFNIMPVKDVFNNKKWPSFFSINNLRTYKLFVWLRSSFLESITKNRDLRKNLKSFDQIPENIKKYIELSLYYSRHMNANLAEKMLEKAISIEPNNIEVYRYFIEKLEDLGNYEEAKNIFAKGLEANPDSPEIYTIGGSLFAEMNDYNGAEKMLNKALEISPDNIEVYFVLAEIRMAQYKFKDARYAIQKARNIFDKSELNDNQKADIYNDLGFFYARIGERKEAENMFVNGIKIAPGNSGELYYNLGTLYKRAGKDDKAENMYRRALEVSSDKEITEESTQRLLMLLQQKTKNGALYEMINKKTYYSDITRKNYRYLRNIVLKKGIKLICVEYPTRSLDELKSFMGKAYGLYFVDNENNFKEAVKTDGYDAYFTDRYGGKFGHMTLKGKKMLAENVSNLIKKIVVYEDELQE